MAGATFGDVGAPLFVPGATFGDVAVSLFVAGATFGDVGVSLFVAGGRIMVGSCLNHVRIGPAMSMTFHPFSAGSFLILECYFVWQAWYLARLERDACCSVHCK